MSKALSISELTDLLGNHWTTEDPTDFQPLARGETARPADMAALAQAALQLQAAAAHSEPAPPATTAGEPASRAGDPGSASPEDPLRQAWEAGFESGIAMERRLSREANAADRELLEKLRDEIRLINGDGQQMLESRIREAVLALCRQAIDDHSLSPERLATRVETAVKMLAATHNEKTIEVSQSDFDLLRGTLPEEWKLIAIPELSRGTVRVVTPEGGVEDGPEQWKLALEEAIRTC